MTDTGWIVTGLVALIVTLFGLVIRNLEMRLTALETHVREHDEWAGIKAEELATLREGQRNLVWRLDRIDGMLDNINRKLDRQARPT